MVVASKISWNNLCCLKGISSRADDTSSFNGRCTDKSGRTRPHCAYASCGLLRRKYLCEEASPEAATPRRTREDATRWQGRKGQNLSSGFHQVGRSLWYIQRGHFKSFSRTSSCRCCYRPTSRSAAAACKSFVAELFMVAIVAVILKILTGSRSVRAEPFGPVPNGWRGFLEERRRAERMPRTFRRGSATDRWKCP